MLLTWMFCRLRALFPELMQAFAKPEEASEVVCILMDRMNIENEQTLLSYAANDSRENARDKFESWCVKNGMKPHQAEIVSTFAYNAATPPVGLTGMHLHGCFMHDVTTTAHKIAYRVSSPFAGTNERRRS